MKKKMIRFSLLFFLLVFLVSCGSSKPQADIDQSKSYRKAEKDAAYFFDDNPDSIKNFENMLSEQEDDEEKITLEKVETKKESVIPLPGEVSDRDFNETLSKTPENYLGSSIRVSGDEKINGNSPNYSQIKGNDIVKEISWKTKSTFGISYYAVDDLSYNESNQSYSRIYKDGNKSKDTGVLLISSSRFLYRTFLDFKFCFNLGVKYNSGVGTFPDGSQSETKFTLWSIPIDMGLGIDIPISRFLKFSVSGGPSALLLLQSRDDRTYAQGDKSQKQYGYGYYGSAQALFGLSSIFPSYGTDLYSDYGIGQSFLSLEFRTVKYDNFKENLTVDGTSMGVGMIFEFL